MVDMIFVASYCFPNAKNPQLGRYVLEQCVELRKRGIEIVVLNVAPSKKIFGNNKITLRQEEGFEVYETTARAFALARLPRLTTAIYRRKYRRLLKKAIAERGVPKKIYAHFSFPVGFAFEQLSREFNVPLVVMEHHSLFFRPKLAKFFVERLRATVERCDAFMCVSKALRDAVATKAGCASEKLSVVHDVIEERFQYKEPIPKERFVFFAAGNLVPGKRFGLLLDATALLRQSGVDFELRIAGDGSEREALKTKIVELRLEDCVRLLGRVDKERMLREYVEADAFVLPSQKETFGIVYRESLLVGRPVISSANGGIEEDWDDSFGIVLKETTAETLADAMRRLVDEYATYDLKAIAERARENCSPDYVCGQILDALR